MGRTPGSAPLFSAGNCNFHINLWRRQVNEPRRQHLVPKFILKNFVDDSGLLHCYRKDTGDREALTPKEALWEEYFYSKDCGDGAWSHDAEHCLSRIENEFARICPMLKRAARAGEAVPLSNKKLKSIRRFLRVQFVRSRGVRNWIEQHPSGSRAKKNAWIELIFNAPLDEDIEAALASEGVVFQFCGASRKVFIIGDSPICAQSFEFQGQQHTEVSMPLASDVVIAMSTTVGHPIARQLSERQVAILNEDVAKHSDIFASQSPATTECVRHALMRE